MVAMEGAMVAVEMEVVGRAAVLVEATAAVAMVGVVSAGATVVERAEAEMAAVGRAA